MMMGPHPMMMVRVNCWVGAFSMINGCCTVHFAGSLVPGSVWAGP
jgi:hypothetical protein